MRCGTARDLPRDLYLRRGCDRTPHWAGIDARGTARRDDAPADRRFRFEGPWQRLAAEHAGCGRAHAKIPSADLSLDVAPRAVAAPALQAYGDLRQNRVLRRN